MHTSFITYFISSYNHECALIDVKAKQLIRIYEGRDYHTNTIQMGLMGCRNRIASILKAYSFIYFQKNDQENITCIFFFPEKLYGIVINVSEKWLSK